MDQFIDNPREKMLEISGSAPDSPESIPMPPEPPMASLPPDEQIIPWSPVGEHPTQSLESFAMTGPYDAWAAIVDKVQGADDRTIEVTRADVRWNTNNEPEGIPVASAFSQPQTAIATALPFPPRHDQMGYLTEPGDIVTVITGRDGLCWYFNDELPFVGRVIKASGGAATEANTGGAGLLTLTVRRQAISGDPDDVAFAGATLSNVLDAASATIDYSGVLVIKPTNQTHGYRTGDYVWVQRRGRYYFAIPAKETFLGAIVNIGPSSEADFATNHYWVREMDPTVTYTTNSWTSTTAARTQTDPTGSGGRYGRWIDAVNLAEVVTLHTLETTINVPVIVSMFADPADGKPYYCFSRFTMPVGTIEAQLLWWDNTAKQWVVLDPPAIDGKQYALTVTDRVLSWVQVGPFVCP